MKFRQRLERVQEALEGNNIDAILIGNGVHVFYLTGFRGVDWHERECYLLVTKDKGVLFVPKMYEEEARGITSADVRVLEVGMKFREVVAKELEMLSLNRVGFEGDVFVYTEWNNLQKLASSIELIHCSGMVEKLRELKDTEELKLIIKAVEIADSAWFELVKCVKSGITEREVVYRLRTICESLGSEGWAFEPIVAGGKNTALPHYRSGDYILKKNDPVLVDFGVVWKEYKSDMTRMMYLGKPSDEFMNRYVLVCKALEAAREQVVAGNKAGQIHDAALAVLGDESVFMTHTIGHGVGLEIHEGPRMFTGIDNELRENMVVTIEPGVYYPGKFGIRVEDLGVVKPGDFSILSHSKSDLVIID